MIYDVYGDAFDYTTNTSVYDEVFCFGVLTTIEPSTIRRGPSADDTRVRRGISADDTTIRRGPSSVPDTVRR